MKFLDFKTLLALAIYVYVLFNGQPIWAVQNCRSLIIDQVSDGLLNQEKVPVSIKVDSDPLIESGFKEAATRYENILKKSNPELINEKMTDYLLGIIFESYALSTQIESRPNLNNIISGFPVSGYDSVRKMTPYGDPYHEKMARPFENFNNLKGELDLYLKEKEERIQNSLNIRAGFGFSGSIKEPNNTVAFFKGFQVESLQTVVDLVEQGLTSKYAKNLESEVEQFVAMTYEERVELLSTAVLNRVVSNLGGILVGGAQSLSTAIGWGQFVIEYDVPKESIFYKQLEGLYQGEDELFVPFIVKPEWAKRIINSKTRETVHVFK